MIKTYCLGFLLFAASCNQDKAKEFVALSKSPIHLQSPISTYDRTKKTIDSNRRLLERRYLNPTTSEKQKVSAEADSLIFKAVNEDLFKHWQGTSWDFNGATTEPKQGNIACGYFVTTMIRDAGFKLNRIKLSTCPSLVMMKALGGAASIKNLSLLRF